MQFADQRVTEVFEAYAARHREENERLGGLAPSEVGARRDEFLLPVGAERPPSSTP